MIPDEFLWDFERYQKIVPEQDAREKLEEERLKIDEEFLLEENS